MLSAAAMTLLFAACSKDDDNGSSNTWSVGSNSYTATTVTTNGPQLVANNGTKIVTATFTGSSLPTSGGSFAVVGAGMAANEVMVGVTDGTVNGTYVTTGTDNKTATVTVSGGKVKIVATDLRAKNTNGDSTTISLNITQN